MKTLFSEKIHFQSIVIIFLVSCFYFYEFVVQSIPGIISQDLMQELSIDATKIGLISSCFYLSYTPLQLISGLLLDRYGSKIILTTVVLIFSFCTSIFANTYNIYIIIITRIVMGATASCAFIGVLHLITRLIPRSYFAFFAGLAEMMGAIGGIAGNKLVAFFLQYYGWRDIIRGFSYIGFILALLIWFLIKNEFYQSDIEEYSNKKNFFVSNLRIVLQNKESWMLGTYSFLIWAQVLGFAILWGIPFLKLSCNLNNIGAAKAISYIWLGIAIGSPVIGWVSDCINQRRIIMIICGLLGTIFMTIVLIFSNIPILSLNAMMLILGISSAGQTLPFAIIRDHHTLSTSSTANGFNNLCIVCGGIFFPLIIGNFLDIFWHGQVSYGHRIYDLHNYRIALSILPLCYLLSTIISIFGIKEPFKYCSNSQVNS